MRDATTLSWDEIKAMVAQLAIQSLETDRRMQETDRYMQETARMIRELREQSKETDRMIRELRRQIGGLGNRLGDFVEDMVKPAVVRLFQERGLPVHRFYSNLVARGEDGRPLMEVDLLVVNGNHAVVVECKSRPNTADVDALIKKLDGFKRCFPEHGDRSVHGALVGLGMPDGVAAYADQQGLWVLVQVGDDVVVRNRPGFEPRSW